MHFFRRLRLKGIRHIIFYQPPLYPHFYSEMVNAMQVNNIDYLKIYSHCSTKFIKFR